MKRVALLASAVGALSTLLIAPSATASTQGSANTAGAKPASAPAKCGYYEYDGEAFFNFCAEPGAMTVIRRHFRGGNDTDMVCTQTGNVRISTSAPGGVVPYTDNATFANRGCTEFGTFVGGPYAGERVPAMKPVP